MVIMEKQIDLLPAPAVSAVPAPSLMQARAEVERLGRVLLPFVVRVIGQAEAEHLIATVATHPPDTIYYSAWRDFEYDKAEEFSTSTDFNVQLLIREHRAATGRVRELEQQAVRRAIQTT